jgi:sigma-B regulation protein RsbU (phosphoserine phosphatase)
VNEVVFVVDPHSGVPVYRQVMGQVKYLIAGGTLSPGDELPSARTLSSQLGVNPSTVSKAYGRLAGQGIIRRRYGRPVVIKSPEEKSGAGKVLSPSPGCEESESVRSRLGAANSEAARVFSDPLVQQCLEQFSNIRHRSIEKDLEKASQVQEVLLPPQDLEAPGWTAAYHYDAFGPTSGDYCDFIHAPSGDVYFVLADVMGKGLAASLLMAHLHASFRALIPLDLPLQEMIARVNGIFCESTPDSFFATLVCGRAARSGEVEICNAGHPSPLVWTGEEVVEVGATGLPVGLFPNQEFSTFSLRLEEEDKILVYSDGVSESQNEAGVEYGTERLTKCLRERHGVAPGELIERCGADMRAFRSGGPRTDDITILAVNRTGTATAPDGEHPARRRWIDAKGQRRADCS